MKRFLLLATACLALRTVQAQDFIDRLDRSLSLSVANDQIRARLSGLFDLDYYNYRQPPPGLIRASGHNLLAPRLTLFVDAHAGTQIYFFVQARLDSGFDPSDRGTRVGLDEYALRFTPWEDGRFSLQLGRFATVIGNWVERHHSWDNPFVTAPLPYGTPTRISDRFFPTAYANRIDPSDKYVFLPIIWGPVYATGIATAGTIGAFDYAAEVKNAPPASRPETWAEEEWNHPAVAARAGWRPSPAWRGGVSAAEGIYLQPEGLAEGGGGDYREVLLGQDLSYARGHLQLWAEAFETEFEVPRRGRSRAFAYYFETKYKLAPQLFAALRWNQEFFTAGDSLARPPDVSRADLALGYRFTESTQLKLQYSLGSGDFLSSHFASTLAAQFTIRF